jgi:histidyl-tRNA synthetase
LWPDVTTLLRQRWRRAWSKTRDDYRMFYVARCYRDDAPRAGRLREFTQLGVEWLGGRAPGDRRTVIALLGRVLDALGVGAEIVDSPRRRRYYTEPGFEVRSPHGNLAAGGRYAEGVGWAIGLDRVLGHGAMTP